MFKTSMHICSRVGSKTSDLHLFVNVLAQKTFENMLYTCVHVLAQVRISTKYRKNTPTYD